MFRLLWIQEITTGSLEQFSVTYVSLATSDTFKIFWSFIQKNLDKSNQKWLLQLKDRDGCSFLMRSAFNQDKATIKLVLKIFREFFTEMELCGSLFFLFWFNHFYDDFDQFGINFVSKVVKMYLCIFFKTLEHLDSIEIKNQILFFVLAMLQFVTVQCYWFFLNGFNQIVPKMS